MAKNDIRSRTVTFMAIQSVILGIIMLAFVVLASLLFVKNATRWQLRNIEDEVLMFAKQAGRSGEVPKRGDLGVYTLFILTQDGKYILPRMPRTDDEGENLWQEYEHKLVYEMQKRRDGWIYYPERERLGWNDGQYVIRYVYLEQQGWIVAVEGYVSSEWSMLKGFLTPKLFMGLFLIVFLAFAMMLLSAFWHFRRVIKAIFKAQENNFIAAPGKPQAEAAFVKRDEGVFASGMTHKDAARLLPKSRPEKLPAQEESWPDEPPSLSERADLSERSERREAPKKPARKELPASGTRQLDNLGEATIDTVDIRSPLLKKALEEMREGKKGL